MEFDKLLNDLYYVKKNFDGVEGLYRKARNLNYNIPRKYIVEWLREQKTSALVNGDDIGKKKVHLPIYSELSYSFQIDLTFFPRYEKQNDGYTVLFTAINVNTRFAYAYYSKSKDADTILGMVRDMYEKTIINSFTCDEGGEFNNRKFIKFCEDNDITIYFVKEDSHKLGVINRFHRTLKNKLTKYFIANNTVKWYDVIGDIIRNYNNTVNRGIGIEPIKVNDFIEHEIIVNARDKTNIIKKYSGNFDIGDSVVLKRDNTLFRDKMKSLYDKKVYSIVGESKNSLVVSDDKGNIKTVKKSNARKIKDYNVVEDNDAVEEANKISRETRLLKKSGVDVNNIIVGKRVRKAKVRM